MKSSKEKLLIILLVTLFLFSGCNNDNNSNVHDFSIYLVKDLSTVEAMNKDLEKLILEKEPLLTDKEIRKYNWQEHSFSLMEGFSLEDKLEGKVPLNGKPFVVVVDNERIYLGSFWTPISSLYVPEIPTIYSVWFKDNKRDSYIIKYGYKQNDPRDDKRIYDSLNGLKKIDKMSKL